MKYNDSVILSILNELSNDFKKKFGHTISTEDLHEIICEGQLKFTSECIENRINISWKGFGKFSVSVYIARAKKYEKEMIEQGVDKAEAKFEAREQVYKELIDWHKVHDSFSDANYLRQLVRIKNGKVF